MNPLIIAQTKEMVRRLLDDFPELNEDDALKLDAIEGETDFNNLMRRLVIEAKAAAAMAEGCIATMNEMAERSDRLSARENRTRWTIASLMDVAGLKKLPLPEATISLSRRGPYPAHPNMDELPEKFIRTKTIRSPDMKAIADAIKAGETIPGVTMTNGSSVLTIRS